MKRYLLAGLLAWLPLTITVWVLVWLTSLLDGIFDAVLRAAQVLLLPPAAAEALSHLRQVPGIGVLVMVTVVLLTGVAVTNIFGQWVATRWDALMGRIPLVKNIYNSVKQVSDTLFSSSGNAFREAVLVPYPHAESWTIAFVTGKPGGEVAERLGGEYVSLYVPTTPNPTSGFFLMMPRSAVRPLHMSVDQALKYIISMGVVAPAARAPLPRPREADPNRMG